MFETKKDFTATLLIIQKKCFNENGLLTYNELILAESIGSAQLRCKRFMNSARKVVKRHQNVLVFYKGNPKNIKAIYPEIEIDDSIFYDEN